MRTWRYDADFWGHTHHSSYPTLVSLPVTDSSVATFILSPLCPWQGFSFLLHPPSNHCQFPLNLTIIRQNLEAKFELYIFPRITVSSDLLVKWDLCFILYFIFMFYYIFFWRYGTTTFIHSLSKHPPCSPLQSRANQFWKETCGLGLPLRSNSLNFRGKDWLEMNGWQLSHLLHLSFVNALDLIIRLPAQQGSKQVMSCYQFIRHDKVITAINEHVLWNGGVANWNAEVWDVLLAKRRSNEDDGKSNMKEDKCLHCSFVRFTS